MEWIPPIFDFEHAEQEAIHEQHDSSPHEDGQLLLLWLDHSRHLQSQRDGRKGENTV